MQITRSVQLYKSGNIPREQTSSSKILHVLYIKQARLLYIFPWGEHNAHGALPGLVLSVELQTGQSNKAKGFLGCNVLGSPASYCYLNECINPHHSSFNLQNYPMQFFPVVLTLQGNRSQCLAILKHLKILKSLFLRISTSTVFFKSYAYDNYEFVLLCYSFKLPKIESICHMELLLQLYYALFLRTPRSAKPVHGGGREPVLIISTSYWAGRLQPSSISKTKQNKNTRDLSL